RPILVPCQSPSEAAKPTPAVGRGTQTLRHDIGGHPRFPGTRAWVAFSLFWFRGMRRLFQRAAESGWRAAGSERLGQTEFQVNLKLGLTPCPPETPCPPDPVPSVELSRLT